MKYNRFEELPVWQAAIEFAVKVFELTANTQFKGYYSLKDQLERAAVSISNNIAEGFERGTTNELLHFVYIARGSSGECRSMMQLLSHMNTFSELRAEIATLRSRAENISKQLGGWAESLQKNESKGARYAVEMRKKEQKRKEYEEWRRELERAQQVNIESGRRKREEQEKIANGK
jgi:four helix bundle protein